jgi:hypothetical protein
MTKQTVQFSKGIKVQPTGLSGSMSMRDLLVAAYRIDDQLNDSKEAKGSMSEFIMKVATQYKDAQSFLDRCSMEEKFFKSDEGLKFLKKARITPSLTSKGKPKLPASWSQYKSDIKIGWQEFDMNPVDYSSYKAYKEELNERRKAQREADSEGEEGSEAEGTVKQINADIADLLVQIADQYEAGDEQRKEDITVALNFILAASTAKVA